MVKNLPTVQKTWVQSLGHKVPLEKGMAAHSSILAWRILCTEEPCALSLNNFELTFLYGVRVCSSLH